MGKLALCMIVKDEPIDRVAMLVDYTRHVADHVIIADTGSERSDIEEYAKWGVDAYSIPWTDDFAAARNTGLDRLPEDIEWVLHLDADEMMSWTMAQHVAWIKENAPAKVKAYRVWTKNFWGGELGIEHPSHWHVRLFRRHGARWYKKLHEQVMIDGKREENLGASLERMNKDAYLIHSKPREQIEKSAMLYKRMEGS